MKTCFSDSEPDWHSLFYFPVVYDVFTCSSLIALNLCEYKQHKIRLEAACERYVVRAKTEPNCSNSHLPLHRSVVLHDQYSLWQLQYGTNRLNCVIFLAIKSGSAIKTILFLQQVENLKNVSDDEARRAGWSMVGWLAVQSSYLIILKHAHDRVLVFSMVVLCHTEQCDEVVERADV